MLEDRTNSRKQSKRERRAERRRARPANSPNEPFRIKLNYIEPKTRNQRKALELFGQKNLVLTGWAGTGKTFLGVYLGLCEVENGTAQKLVIVRSAVPTRDIGFLPGKAEDKLAVYEAPYLDIFKKLMGKSNSYEMAKKAGLIEFVPTSFLRGTTFDNCCVLVDEFQNMDFDELDTVITRLGSDSSVIFSGDQRQSDLERTREKSGIKKFLRILDDMNEFANVDFGLNDIVRSGLVKSYLIAKEGADEPTGQDVIDKICGKIPA